jgi:hypothetical protein
MAAGGEPPASGDSESQGEFIRRLKDALPALTEEISQDYARRIEEEHKKKYLK